MDAFMELKEKIRIFYGKNDMFLRPVGRFLLALFTFISINGRIGYMPMLKNGVITLAMALLCGVFPSGASVLFITLFIVGHLYAASMELAIIAFLVFLLMYLLYFHFSAKYAGWFMVSILAANMGIPTVIPVAAGLLSGIFSCIPVIFGVIVYYIMNYAKYYVDSAAAVVSNSEQSDMFDNILTIVSGLLNRELILIALSFTMTVVIVYVIRRLSINYSWVYAIIAGALTDFVMLLFGNMIFGTSLSTGSLFLGLILSVATGFVLMFLFFNLDYKSTERVQYEDDEYYYYVKAVPKYCVPTSNVKVKKINTTKKRQAEDVDDFEDIDIDI